ncbi:MAG: ATP-binding protein [Daejeonella sp.]|uniref:sensor histidine kinase n=1 Tax=Daejeonella sp. TaxID=2805397 RepID=UPI003C712B94
MEIKSQGLFAEAAEFFTDIFSTQYWPARWNCGRWTDFHGWLYIISDLMIWAAYFAIPFLLFRLITKRTDFPFPKIFWLFIAFILLCGSTHLMDAVIFWWPAYRFSALLRFVTGTVSLFTVYALYRVLPMVMNLRTAAQVEAEAEQRRRAEKQFSNVFNFSAVGMALLSPEGKWMKVNPALSNFLGYSEQEMQNLTFQDITYKDDLDRDLQYVKQMLDGTIASYQMEKRYIKKDGSLWWGLLACTLMKDHDGKPDFFIVQIADLNNSKKLQEALEVMERKDEFLSIAAHELKTPITSVKGALQILDVKLNKTDQDNVSKPLISLANKQVNKLTWLVNDLLDAARIQSGRLSLSISSFKIEDLVSGAIEQVFYERKDVNIVYQENVPHKVEGDKSRLEQVLVNLLSNAIKYSPAGRDIIIKTEQLEGKIKFSVTDFGIGIASEKIPRLFERYFRVESTSQNFSGLGIGLYISAEIVRMHNGSIGADSRLGEGSTFYFSIPNKYDEPKEKPQSSGKDS